MSQEVLPFGSDQSSRQKSFVATGTGSQSLLPLPSIPTSLGSTANLSNANSTKNNSYYDAFSPNSSYTKHKSRQPPSLALSSNETEKVQLPFSAKATPFPPSEAPHALIQSTWSLFSAIPDGQRNQLLKGLLDKCSSVQVDLICTYLNLKMSDPILPGYGPTYYSTDAHGKFAPQNRIHLGAKTPLLQSKPTTSTSIGTSKIQTANTIRQSIKTTGTLTCIEMELHEESYKSKDDATLQPQLELHKSKRPGRNESRFHPSNKSPQSDVTSTNVYMKLLSDSEILDPDSILRQAQVTQRLDTTRSLLAIVTQRAWKQQCLQRCIQSLTLAVEEHSTSLSLLVKCAADVCSAGFVSLFRVDPASGDVAVAASSWAKEGNTVPNAMKNILGAPALFAGEKVNVFNAKESDLYTDGVHDFYAVNGKCEVECLLSVPVKNYMNKVLGFVEVINKVSENASPYFNAEDEYMLKCVANIWLLIMESMGGQGRSGSTLGGGPGIKKKEDIKMLMNTANFMSSDIDLNGLVRVVMQTAQELMGAERCALFLVDNKTKELWSSVAEGAGEIRIPMSKGIAGFVAMSGEVLNIPNAYKDPRFNRSIDIKTGFHTRNILCVPMKNSKGQVIGVAQIINKLPDPSAFTVEDEMLLTAFSSLAATTIEKNMVFQEMQDHLDTTIEETIFLSNILQKVPSVIITLDCVGQMRTINNATALDLSEDQLNVMKSNSFDVWLGSKANAILIDDIRRIFKGREPSFVRDYEMVLNGKVIYVNYSVNSMTDEGTDSPIAEVVPPNGQTLSTQIQVAEETNNETKKMIRKPVEGAILIFEIIDELTRVNEVLSKYMNQSVIRKLETEGIDFSEGMKGKATCMSVDVRNFERMIESLSPANIFEMLNVHHCAIHEAVNRYNGYMDKVSNDKGLALFGVPVANEDGEDAFNAVQCALKLIQSHPDSLDRLVNSSIPGFQIGVGISTGPVLAGLVGPSNSLNFASLGRAVSLSSLIREATKLYETGLLICEMTQREVRDKFHLREIDNVIFKGYLIPITLYEVLGLSTAELPRELITATICFELGLSEYRSQNWSVAQLHFKKAIQTSDDGPSRMFVKRCQSLLDGLVTLPPDWDGVWTL